MHRPRALQHPVSALAGRLADAYRSIAGPPAYGKRYMHRMARHRNGRTLRRMLHS
jgi:hypothetical protein